MSLGLLLVIVLIVLLVGAAPNFGLHSYGYQPMGILGVILVIVLVLLLLGRL